MPFSTLPMTDKLSQRNGEGWDILEKVARNVAAAGGITVMGYYRQVEAFAPGDNNTLGFEKE